MDRLGRTLADELQHFITSISAEHLEYFGHDGLGIEPCLRVHRGGAVLIDEYIRKHHAADLQSAIQHPVLGKGLKRVRTETADCTFLDRDEYLMLAREPQQQIDIERL